MLMGRGYTFDDKNAKTSKWNNGKVWKHWKIVPTALEICVRRIKWYQDIARWPVANAQLITSIYGAFPGVPPTLNEHGMLMSDGHINFAARNIKNDLDLICKSECGHEFACTWFGRYEELFGGVENHTRQAFLDIDPSYLRAQFFDDKTNKCIFEHFIGAIPANNDFECEMNEEDEDDTVHICNILMSNGVTCCESFRTQRALLAHQRRSNLDAHDSTRLFHQLTMSNRCINCKTCFRTHFEAGQHLTRAYHSGRCLKDYTHEIYDFIPPNCTMTCPICIPKDDEGKHSYASFDLLEQHLATHLPVTLQGLPIRVVDPPSSSKEVIIDPAKPKAKAKATAKQKTAKLGPKTTDKHDDGLEAKTLRIFQKELSKRKHCQIRVEAPEVRREVQGSGSGTIGSNQSQEDQEQKSQDEHRGRGRGRGPGRGRRGGRCGNDQRGRGRLQQGVCIGVYVQCGVCAAGCKCSGM